MIQKYYRIVHDTQRENMTNHMCVYLLERAATKFMPLPESLENQLYAVYCL